MVEKFIYNNAHVLTLIFQAKSTEVIFRHLPIHLHVAGGQVHQGHGGGHHVGGGEVHFSQFTCSNLIFQAKSTNNILRHVPIYLHVAGGQVQQGHGGGHHVGGGEVHLYLPSILHNFCTTLYSTLMQPTENL